MGTFDEGRELSRNSEGKNYSPNQFALTSSFGHDEALPCIDNLEGQKEPVPSMEKPLEAEVHAEETIGEGN